MFLCRSLMHERLLHGEGQMAVSRFWSSSVQGISSVILPQLRLSYQLHWHFSTMTASRINVACQAKDAGSSAGLEELTSESSKKKERLSRKERTALVESFVLKHMEAHQGAFPSMKVVLKETGGARNVVKEILSTMEGQFAKTKKVTGSFASEDLLPCEVPVSSSIHDLATTVEIMSSSENSSSDSSSEEESEDETEGDDNYPGLESRRLSKEITEVERKHVTITNGQMIGSSQGEIETHSGLWTRLRGMGAKKTANQGYQQQSGNFKDARAQTERLLSRRVLDQQSRQEINPEIRASKENRFSTIDSVALGYTDPTKRLFNQNRNQNGIMVPKDSPDRHGLFVRYLSPNATSADMVEAFVDCGEIVRAQAIKGRSTSMYTYGFVDFKTVEGLQKALDKENVYIKGTRIQKEPSSSARRVVEKSLRANGWATDLRSSAMELSTSSLVGTSKIDSTITSGCKVAVGGIPMHTSLLDIQRALSKYGEIILTTMKQDDSGSYTAYLEFKRGDAREKALSEGSVQLNGVQYSILRDDPVKTSVVRVSNFSSEHSIDQIRATCMLFGQVEKVIIRCNGAVDVHFQSSEADNFPRILSRLNNVNMEGQHWQAQPAFCLLSGSSDAVFRTRDGQEWVQLETERMLNKVDTSLKKLVVDIEDLQELVKVNSKSITAQKINVTISGTSAFF